MWTITVHVSGLHVCKCYTTIYNDNNVMYHKARHELYFTGNTIKIELKSI